MVIHFLYYSFYKRDIGKDIILCLYDLTNLSENKVLLSERHITQYLGRKAEDTLLFD